MDTALDLQAKVRTAYTQIADAPDANPPFPTGRALALDLGYPEQLLESLPAASVEAFCGVSNVSLFADIGPQSVVLDLGCGAGLDTLIAAHKAAKVIGVDFSPSMLARAGQAAREAGMSNKVTLLQCEAQRLPLPDASVDVAIVNGIFNLNPHRQEIFQELARVVRPGGQLFVAEIILHEALPDDVLQNPTSWFT